MKFSISDRNKWSDCNYRWHKEWELQRTTPPSLAQQIGTEVHKYVALRILHSPSSARSQYTHQPHLESKVAPLLDIADALVQELRTRYTAIHIESAFERRFNNNQDTQVGRLDSVFATNTYQFGETGGLWSGQLKTMGRGRNLGQFLDSVLYSPHEVLYRQLLRQVYPASEVAGTLLMVIRTALTKEQQRNNVPAFEIFELRSSVVGDALHLQQLNIDFEHMVAQLSQPTMELYLTRRNMNACFKPMARCPLVDHCYRGVDAQSLLTVPLEDRYPEFTGRSAQPRRHPVAASPS